MTDLQGEHNFSAVVLFYTRQQVFSRVPISGSNWTSGKQASFVLEATGGRYFVPSESRIVMKLRAKSG